MIDKLKNEYINYKDNSNRTNFTFLVVAIELPNKEVELITNQGNNSNIISKIQYYIDTYDDTGVNKENPDVRIIDFMLV